MNWLSVMRKTEVYQVRLDSQEKKQAFAVFKQLGITPAQAVRLFFKQVVITKSIPFSIENQNINLDSLKNKKTNTAYEQHNMNDDEFLQTLQALLNNKDHP